jgi:hypothetical protein
MKGNAMEDKMTTNGQARVEVPRAQIKVLRKLVLGTAEWARSCADYYAAAGLYERLSKLSDAELRRRGLSRDTLARTVFDTPKRDQSS